MTEYMVVCQQIVGGSDHGGFETIYGCDGRRFRSRERAKAHGFQVRESDDFNIAVLKRGRLVSFDWMDKPVGEDAATLAVIAEQIGVKP